MTDELSFETAGAGTGSGAGCPRCEEPAGFVVFREWHRPVARGQGVLWFLVAAVPFDLAARLLLGGRAVGVVPLAIGVLLTVPGMRAVVLGRSGGPVEVGYCRQCTARSTRAA